MGSASRREDLDPKGRKLVTRHSDNKGRRDEVVPLHPVVVDHLRRIVGFHPLVFRWAHDDKTHWVEFGRIQREAGIHLPYREDHQHTRPATSTGSTTSGGRSRRSTHRG